MPQNDHIISAVSWAQEGWEHYIDTLMRYHQLNSDGFVTISKRGEICRHPHCILLYPVLIAPI
jgi:hypothetical protein